MHHQSPPIVPKARLFVATAGGEGAFGPGKADLLRAIKENGSLNRAAAALGRSYRQIWGEINNAEKRLGFALVTRSRGGAGHGNTALTERGEKLLRAWDAYVTHLATEIERSFEIYIAPVIGGVGDATKA
jgi:molybdate transport system regulatory protein